MLTPLQAANNPQLNRPTISIAYLQLLIEILKERAIEPDELLCGIPIDPALLEHAQARMSPYQWTLLILRAQSLTQDAGLGYEYGLRMRPTVHGVLGYAAMSCASLRQALELSVRYMHVRQAGFNLRLVEDAQYVHLELIEKFPIPILRSFFYENILLGLARAVAVLLGRELEDFADLEIWFDWPEPNYHAMWQPRLPAIRFDRPVNALRLPRALLTLRPVLADALASQQAIELCERELALSAGHEADITTHLRAKLVLNRQGGYPRLEAVAADLCISPRTLKRKLHRQNTSFLLLLEEARRRDARALLQQSELAIQDIAQQLGYRNPANFSRAFTQWTGESPSRYRLRILHSQTFKD